MTESNQRLLTSRYLLGLERSTRCYLLLLHTLDNLLVREGKKRQAQTSNNHTNSLSTVVPSDLSSLTEVFQPLKARFKHNKTD